MNIGKTQAMFVLPRGLNIPPDTAVMCNCRPLQLVTAYKYLGVFLDKSPLQAWCPSNFQSSTVDAISSPLPATSNLPRSSTNGL